MYLSPSKAYAWRFDSLSFLQTAGFAQPSSISSRVSPSFSPATASLSFTVHVIKSCLLGGFCRYCNAARCRIGVLCDNLLSQFDAVTPLLGRCSTPLIWQGEAWFCVAVGNTDPKLCRCTGYKYWCRACSVKLHLGTDVWLMSCLDVVETSAWSSFK